MGEAGPGRLLEEALAKVVGIIDAPGLHVLEREAVEERTFELVELGESFDGVRGKRVVVTARDLEQRRRPHSALEVDVELELRVRHEACVVASSRPERRSTSTESQIESS